MKQRKLLMKMKIIIKIAHPLIENTKLSKVEIYAELCPLIVQISKTLSRLEKKFLFMLPPQVVQSPPQPLFHQLAFLPSHLRLHGSHHEPKQNNQKCQ